MGLFRAINITPGAHTPYIILSRSIYVYSEVIQTKLVGDSSVPLLSVVPLCGVFWEMAFKEYYSPVYTPLAKHVFSTIEMYITDIAGRPVPFSSGKVTVLLHFKQKDD